MTRIEKFIADSKLVFDDDKNLFVTMGFASSVPTMGRLASTTPGTAVQLPDVAGKMVYFQGDPANGEYIAHGGAGVKAAAGAGRLGFFLSQGQYSPPFYIDNLNRFYLDVITSGDAILYVYFV